MARPKLYTLPEAADKIGCNKVTVYRWVQRGIVQPDKVAGAQVLTTQQVNKLRKHILGK